MVTSLIALAAAAGLCASAPAADDASTPAPLGGWEYRWDDPVRDDHGMLVWPSAEAAGGAAGWRPTAPYQQLPERNGRERVWYRVHLPEGPWIAPTVFLEGVDNSFEAYLHGHRVYSWGDNGEGAQPFLGWPWHLIPVHPDPGDRYLYLRVRSTDPQSIGLYGRTLIGNTQDHIRDILSRDLLEVFLGLTELALGLAALIVFLGRREQRVYLYFALYAISQGASTIAFTDVKQLAFDAAEVWRMVLRVGRVVGFPLLLAFAAEAMGLRKLLFARITAALVGAGLVVLVFASFGPPWASLALMHWANGAFLVGTAGSCVISAVGAARRVMGARLLLAALTALVIAGVHDALVSLGVITGTLWYAWVELFAIAAMSGILLQRFMSVFDQLRIHAAAVEQQNMRLAVVEADLQDAVRTRDEFLSVASHELRNPLATITADAWLLERDASRSEEGARAVTSIARQARHLTRLVDDMLDTARVARGALTLRTEPVEIHAALEEVVHATSAAAADKGLAVRVDRAPAPTWTLADPTRLDQILGNILRNAIKYTDPGGSIRISCALENEQVVVRVRDTGVGMTPEMLARVFRLFERGGSTAVDGMGVGLALVQSLVELHGGTVAARSEGVGRGTEFEVRLPACAAPASSTAHELDRAQASTPVAAAVSAPFAVLLIDDNENLRRSLRMALQLNGFTVSEAPDGESGLEHLLSGRFNAAVVDLRMPGMDGCEVARRVRASDHGRRLKLIALTGHAQHEERARAEEAGFNQVLLKPTDPDELARLLR